MSRFYSRFAAITTIIILLLGLVYVVFANREICKFTRAERIMFLVSELTATPKRQQVALDEIVKDGDGAFIYLFRYLDDKRALATRDVRFLNTHPGISDKYFLTRASSVDELILRYLCWKTISCDAWFDVHDEAHKAVQRQKIAKFCEENFLDPSKY